MFGTRTFWRTFAGGLAVAVAASAAAALNGGGFWTPLLAAAIAAALAAWRLGTTLTDGGDAATATAGESRFESTAPRHEVRRSAPEHGDDSPASALLGTVLETMIEGVMVADAREHLVYANPAARTLLDIPAHLSADRPLLEAVRSPGIEAAMQAALATGVMQQAELELPRKERTVALTASPLAGGTAAGVVLVLHDVTELRRLERMRREFVSNVSHELKTPLTHIQAYADTLAEGALDDPEHGRKFLGRIIEQAERLQALIVDLLRLAQIESQEEAVDVEPLDLSAAATRSVEEHQAAAASSGVTLTIDSRAAPIVPVDSAGLRQIIDNLLDNALKYTPAEGTVRVTVSSEDRWGVLEVADTGIGIARDDQPRVFERFYRVDKARARSVGGTGLGLSIVKHLVQHYGGRIELTSELGRGSRFTIRLPVWEGNRAEFEDRKS